MIMDFKLSFRNETFFIQVISFNYIKRGFFFILLSPYFRYVFVPLFHCLGYFTFKISIGSKIFFEHLFLHIGPNRSININIFYFFNFSYFSLLPFNKIINFGLYGKYILHFNLRPYKIGLFHFINYLIPTSSSNYTFY